MDNDMDNDAANATNAGASAPRWQLDAHRVRELLAVLDQRLQRRGIAASVYVVGGVAVALTVQPRRRPSLDLDAMVTHRAVIEEADAIAVEEGLPPHWLNSAAQPWLPPRPAAALQPRKKPGLDVHIAPPAHLLAMKIVAFRDRDVDDIIDLAHALDLTSAAADGLAALVVDIYQTPELLATAIGGPDADVDRELLLRCQRIATLLGPS